MNIVWNCVDVEMFDACLMLGPKYANKILFESQGPRSNVHSDSRGPQKQVLEPYI